MERTIGSPIGPLCITERDGAVAAIEFRDGGTETSPLLVETERQLRAYFSENRQTFALPLAPEGTPFQRSVWEALCTIPYGETRAYGEIAAQIGCPRAARAVGMANHCNPIPIVIPCHRVIGKDGSLTGYGGGLDKKIYLLELEKLK